MPHTIRLRGPWSYAVVHSSGVTAGTFRVPGEVPWNGGSDRPLRFEMARMFHRPTGLNEPCQVRLLGSGSFGDFCSVVLNDILLGTCIHSSFDHNVTRLLQPSNRLALIVARSEDASHEWVPLVDDVKLEIGSSK